MSPAEFAVRARQLGLELDPDDLAELHRGWTGLQAQLARLRDPPPQPTEPPAHLFTVPRPAPE